jgi:hypothetical protein
LDQRKVTDRAGRNKAGKQELVEFLARKYAAAGRDFVQQDSLYPFFLSCIPQIAPSEKTKRHLTADPEETIKSLNFNANASAEMMRLNSLSRDAHVAFIWSSLGDTNAKVVQKLNEWTEDDYLSHDTWFQRRRRGNLLLRFPVFAYQNVLTLDVRPGSLSPARIGELMGAVPELQGLSGELCERFSGILGIGDQNLGQTPNASPSNNFGDFTAPSLPMDDEEELQHVGIHRNYTINDELIPCDFQ